MCGVRLSEGMEVFVENKTTHEVRVTKEDLPLVQEIYDAIVGALGKMPMELMGNEKFGVLTVTALLNMVCRLSHASGAQKDEIVGALQKIWDDMSSQSKELLN